MTMPRSKYVKDGEEGVYHCISRCVRRAFLCGFDAVTGRDYSHRKQWIVDRLRFLASIFAIDVCAYAIMENHPHNILRTRPDIIAEWSDQEVATHWLTLCPRKRAKKNKPIPPLELQIQGLVACPGRIAILRKRLCSVSWFMGRLNEHIARLANKEDGVKGRFWEGRFKCQALLDEAAIAACMSYVDLNPIRAGLAATPEESDFTSIQERIRNWQRENMAECSAQNESVQDDDRLPDTEIMQPDDRTDISTTHQISSSADSWLCPIQSDGNRRGILSMSAAEYFDLVDRSGRIIGSYKRGSIDAHLTPILVRIGAIPGAWSDTVSNFGSRFPLVAGHLDNLRKFATRLGNHWFKGVASARLSFASAPSKE